MLLNMMLPKVIRLPAEYQKVEYIESSGTQYIDTGVTGNTDDLVITVRFNRLAFKGYGGIFGNYVNETTNCWRLLQTNTDNDKFYANRNTQGSGGSNTVTVPKNTISTVIVNKNETVVNGVAYTATATAKGAENTTNIYLFSQNKTGYKSTLRLYSFKINDKGILVRNYVPCYRKSDGVAGLYDAVSGAFYTNAGTGTFSIGATIN